MKWSRTQENIKLSQHMRLLQWCRSGQVCCCLTWECLVTMLVSHLRPGHCFSVNWSILYTILQSPGHWASTIVNVKHFVMRWSLQRFSNMFQCNNITVFKEMTRHTSLATINSVIFGNNFITILSTFPNINIIWYRHTTALVLEVLALILCRNIMWWRSCPFIVCDKSRHKMIKFVNGLFTGWPGY